MLKKIVFLSHKWKFRRGVNDLNPVIKWNSELMKAGISASIHSDIRAIQRGSFDVVAIDSRYLQSGYTLINGDIDVVAVAKLIDTLRKHSGRIALYDSSDGTGTRFFGVTPLVDIHLKKQLLSNKEKYLLNEGDRSKMCWIPESYTPSNIPYIPCRKEDLGKLRVSWNIGMVDYRQFPFQSYLPFGTSALFNNIYKSPFCGVPGLEKSINISYRTGISKDTRYSFQRENVLKVLAALPKQYDVRIGGRISKNGYMKEMKRSRVVVSPYGWGEICYRDFEAFVNGAVLIKPDMDHVVTYPDLFIKNETYIPVAWDISDFRDVVIDVLDNYPDYLPVASRGQSLFIESISDSRAFVDHFIKGFLE